MNILTDWEWKDFPGIKAIEKNHSGTAFGCIEFKFLKFRHQAKFIKQVDNWQKIFSAYITNSYSLLDKPMKNTKIRKGYGKKKSQKNKIQTIKPY